jgi:tetratricopeptide (TPR) repeat protein
VLERLVRSRVDRLSPAAREVVGPASVLGAEFPLSLLTAVCAADQPLGPTADELCARDIWQELAGGQDPAFRFRHALIRDAIYNGLLRAERRRLHGRAAWALEAASQGRLEEAAAVLGHHFAAAGEAERALRYLELAGDHATAAFANDEAVSSYRAALSVSPEPAAAAVLQAKLANVLWRTARRDQAREAFHAALRSADAGDALFRAHLQTRLGRLELVDRRYEAAAAAFDAAEPLLGEDPGSKDDATVDQWLELMLDGRAELYALRGDPELTLVTLEAVRPVLEARGSPLRAFTFYHGLAMGRVIQNRFRVDETDIANIRRSAEAAAQSEEEKDLGYATYFVGRLMWLHGDLAEAQRQGEKALALAERIGETLLLGESLLGLALTALRRHDVEAVRSLAPRAMAAASAMGISRGDSEVKACLAWLAWQDGRPDEVLTLAGQIAEHEAVVGSDSSVRWVYLWPLIAVHLRAGNIAEAVAACRQLRHPAQQRLPDELDSMAEAAAAAWAQGQPEIAGEMLAAALALARDLRYF